VALPLAFVSHFVCDAIPHYDPPEQDKAKLFRSGKFVREFLVIGAALCALLVVVLAAVHPANWLQASICAFLATSPDLFWIPRFVRAQRGQKPVPLRNWFLRLHAYVQWRTGPGLVWVEAVWGIACTAVLALQLW